MGQSDGFQSRCPPPPGHRLARLRLGPVQIHWGSVGAAAGCVAVGVWLGPGAFLWGVGLAYALLGLWGVRRESIGPVEMVAETPAMLELLTAIFTAVIGEGPSLHPFVDRDGSRKVRVYHPQVTTTQLRAINRRLEALAAVTEPRRGLEVRTVAVLALAALTVGLLLGATCSAFRDPRTPLQRQIDQYLHVKQEHDALEANP